MIIAPYKEDRDYDQIFEQVVLTAKKYNQDNDDDFLLLCVGDTGTGKSSLGLHAYELYDPEDCDVKYIGLDKMSFANAMKYCIEKSLPRFNMNDEANISKRDSLTKFNRDILDLYFANRGLNIFHWWNNPSLNMIDKAFIKERIKGVIFVFTKSKDKPRLYYYFHTQQLLKLYEKEDNFDLTTLKNKAKKYAYYMGWFRPYKGKLWNDYLDKKKGRMVDKVQEFYDKYGGDEARTVLSKDSLSKKLHISHVTFGKYEDLFSVELKDGEHYFIDAIGKKNYYAEALKPIAEWFRRKYGN